MDILILNQDWFASYFRRAGHRVVTAGLQEHLDIQLVGVPMPLSAICELAGNDFRPERILVLDESRPFVVTGLNEVDVPVLFYSVDIHHHFDLHKYLGLLCDGMYVAQKDYLPALAEFGVEAEWLPLWASRHMEASSEKAYGAVFIGTLNPSLNPERVAFFDALSKRVPIVCKEGAFWEYFPNSTIVLNQTVKGDLNFRVFEALMSGSLLLTERCANGFQELFREGEHLVCYEKNNVEEAAQRIEYYLAHPELTNEIGLRGRAEVLRAHTEDQRAERVLARLLALEKSPNRGRHWAAALNLGVLSNRLRVSGLPGSAWQALTEAIRAAEFALTAGENPTLDQSWYLVRMGLLLDRELSGTDGHRILKKARDLYPNNLAFFVWELRHLLNLGMYSEARERAQKLVPHLAVEEVFSHVESIIVSLLDLPSGTDAELKIMEAIQTKDHPV